MFQTFVEERSIDLNFSWRKIYNVTSPRFDLNSKFAFSASLYRAGKGNSACHLWPYQINAKWALSASLKTHRAFKGFYTLLNNLFLARVRVLVNKKPQSLPCVTYYFSYHFSDGHSYMQRFIYRLFSFTTYMTGMTLKRIVYLLQKKIILIKNKVLWGPKRKLKCHIWR